MSKGEPPDATQRSTSPISELVNAEVEGRRLTDEEIYSHIRLLFPTGGETTS